MNLSDREELELRVRSLCEGGDRTGAVAAAVRGYGPEILGFLMALHRSEQDAEEVFSIWSERLLRGMGDFAWQSSLRTWAYMIARNASFNFVRGARHDKRKYVAEGSEALAAIEQQVRTETRPYLRTSVKSKLAEIRQSLSPEDRMLLVLRVDKELEWKDIARIMLSEDSMEGGVSIERPDAITKESQRLRKRFQIVKEALIERGKREGLLGEEEKERKA